MLYSTFYVDDTRYGVPILVVREISRPIQVTPVEGADPRIEGLLNLRGQIITVINLGTSLGLDSVAFSKESRLVVMKTEKELTSEATVKGMHVGQDTVALLVDRVGEVVNAEHEEVEPVPAHIDHPFINGVIKLEGELLVIVSAEQISQLQVVNTESGA